MVGYNLLTTNGRNLLRDVYKETFRSVGAEGYFYCHADGVGDNSLLVKGYDLEDANEELMVFLKWAKVPSSRNVCGGIFKP